MTTLVELAYHNALAFQELEFGLINARLAHGLTPEQVGERIFSDRKIDFPTLRAYALAVGAKVTITVETVEVENEPIAQGRTCGGDNDCATVNCSGNTD